MSNNPTTAKRDYRFGQRRLRLENVSMLQAIDRSMEKGKLVYTGPASGSHPTKEDVDLALAILWASIEVG